MTPILHGLEQHAGRAAAYDEVHARPFPHVKAPLSVSCISLMTSKSQVRRQRELLAGLADSADVSPPAADADSYYQSFADYELRWERHQEFCTLVVLAPCAADSDFSRTALSLLPRDWLTGLAGRLLVSFHVLLLEGESPLPGDKALQRLFGDETLFGSRIVDNRAAVWTGFQLNIDDQCSRFVIYNKSLSQFQAGRTLQRIMEVEIYRVMALLGLPLARRVISQVAIMDQELVDIMDRLPALSESNEEKILIDELSELAARTETLRAYSKYRFSATQAYYELVIKRLADIREEKFSGVSTLSKFLERRLTPAVKTCAAEENQLDDLSRRISRASDLLRTNVELSIEEQNQKLLKSMDQRGAMQLRLQQTVEGLSVVAISYYTLGLLRPVLTAGQKMGLMFNLDMVIGLMAVPVVLTVWLLIRRLRHKINGVTKKGA